MLWVGRTAVVTLPAEIDIDNALSVAADLLAALSAGAQVVIADMSGTSFCDVSGLHELASAHEMATANGMQLRVVASGQVLRVLRLSRLNRVLAIYPTLAAALPAGPPGHGGGIGGRR